MPSPTQSRALVVSLHDVSPQTQVASREILQELAGIGVQRCSLLVVANHHHNGNFLENKEFCDWLKAQEEAGHEIVIHGYYHLRERKPGEGTWQKLMTRAYTADEGEFYDIDEGRSAEIMGKALGEFARLHIYPAGFIAPAWLLSAGGERAARKAGFQYTTRLGNVLNLSSGVRHDSMSMVYSVRTGWRRALSLAWNTALYRRLRSNPLLRVSIHPPDIEHKKIWRQIVKCIGLALEDRVPMTYRDWVCARQALHPAPASDHVQS